MGFHCSCGSRQLPFELSHDLSRSIFVQSLAMPVLKTFDAGQTLAFQGSREHDRRTIADSVGGFKRCKEIGNIVSINDQRLPAECFPASLVDFQLVLQHRWLALTQPVDVNDRAEIIEAVERGPLRSLPYRAFSRFTIAHQNKNALVGILELFRIEGHANSHRQTLPQRTGSYVHKGQSGSGMALQIRVDLTQSQQFLSREGTCLRPSGIEDRCGVPLREHEDVTVAIVWIARIVTHHGIEKHSHNLRRRSAARRMTAAGFGRGTDRVNAQAGRLVLQGFQCNLF